MKKLKLNLSNMKGNDMLSREQLKRIMGGAGSGGRCSSSSDCEVGKICCNTTDGSGISACVFPAGGGGCPTSGVGGCFSSCQTGGITVGCYYDTSMRSCRCLNGNAC